MWELLLFIFIGGEVVLHLWNWLLPPLFGWRQITFWQAIGMLVLCRILFGGVSGRGLHRSNSRRRMAERWERMTPEEREKIPARHARTLRLRHAGDREQRVMSLVLFCRLLICDRDRRVVWTPHGLGRRNVDNRQVRKEGAKILTTLFYAGLL